MIKKLLRTVIYIFVFSLVLLPSISIGEQGATGTWSATNVTVYLHKDQYTTGSNVVFIYTCTAKTKVGETICPNSGKLEYSISKNSNPTNSFPYYTFYREIDRKGSDVPDRGWLIRANWLSGSHGNDSIDVEYNVSKVMDNTVATFDKDGNGSNAIPQDATPPKDPYTNPLPPGTKDPGTDGGESGASQGGPLSVLLPFVSINKQGPTSSVCENGSTYTVGILKGVPCNGGAIDSLEEVLQIVKNLVTDFLLPIVGTIFIIMLIIGGILYITSRGDSKQAERAKKTLTAAIVGLIIVILSYTLIQIFISLIGGGVK